MSVRIGLIRILMLTGLLSGTSACHAGFHVSMDTSALNGMGTYYLEFQLVDGSLVDGNGNSQVIVTNFNLTGGTLGAVLPPTFGNVTGSLAGTLTLTDGPNAFGGLADFAQAFSVSSALGQLDFDLDLTASSVDAPDPDNFYLLILDDSFNPIPTDGPVGIEFVTAEFTTTTPTPLGFSSTDPALTAVVTVFAVPEPGSLALTVLGGLSMICGYGSHRRARVGCQV